MKSACVLVVTILSIVFVSSVSATTYYVNGTTGNDAYDGLAAVWDGTHGPKKTIQAGIDASSDTDTVTVASGTYTGTGNKDIDFDGKAITVKSTNGAETTIIDCENSGRGFYFNDGEGFLSQLDGFTITNGSANYGGGIRLISSSPIIKNCVITGNSATYSGGGIKCTLGSNPIIADCIISDNWAESCGGGFEILGGSEPIILRCIIERNSCGAIGTAFYWFDSSPILMECIVTGNGGYTTIFSYLSNAQITNCRIFGNSGTGIEFFHDYATMNNCTISENTGWQGGGVQVTNESDCEITNCTITDNKDISPSGYHKSGIYCNPTSVVDITNCIIWGNEGDEIYVDTGGSATVTYSDVQGGWTGTGNINADPKLQPLAGGMLRLKHGSPCIDAGTSSFPAPATDMEGRSRWDDPSTPNTGSGATTYYDMGAHEFKGWYVNGDPKIGNDAYNGAYPIWIGGLNGPERTIQAGINDATTGDTVTVAPYRYTETGNTDLNFASGLPAGETRLITLTSSHGADTTIIDCKGLTRGINFITGEDTTALLHGFTIMSGYTSTYGAGIRCNNASPTISHCVITGNTANNDGGGIDCENACPVITNCKIIENEAKTGYGGGIDCWGETSNPTIINCEFSGNISTTSNGGGVSCYGANPAITNCLFIGNKCALNGGAIWYYRSEAAVRNSTFSLNDAKGCGSGIACDASSPTITDCILWNDAIDEIGVVSGSPKVTYSDVENGNGEPWFGTGCVDKNPSFASGPLHDYYLSQISAGQGDDSVCLNAGSAPARDLGLDKLTTRTIGGKDLDTVDMGYHSPYSVRIYNILRSGNDITIYWTAITSARYTVQISSDMIVWNDVYTGIVDHWTDVGGGLVSEKYYRVKEE